ncbi:MAG: sigma-54 dependent transcriptional regulator [Desulfobulbus sp.]|jgi:DNA-binding NtrC family response regulator|uniref:sigma-54-dependent transcriptional regulator n=1 Tax=Desulfobulbus sp. TaxID=895 RepID=UPI00284E0281|nr:sigma-54 dependent transcriptional regulator [Desulfobulbus sp.]MDR2549301.1 sigma-54 dependent transcriptional regulator [Desulfobulbus sp.]
MHRYKILIVDDDRLLQNSLLAILSEKYDPMIAGSGEEALRVLQKTAIDLILLDIRLPGIDGIETLHQIKKLGADTPIIMMTAYEDVKTVIHSMKEGASDYLVKPLEIEMFELVIEKALENLRLKKEVQELRRVYLKAFKLEHVVSESEGIKAVFEFADKVARSYDTTVLIEGGSGVGKEVVARMIHHRSSRYDKPFVGINCGAISKELLESELFGYEKGAFTGGLQEGKKGKIEMADSGTLLLDEVSELHPAAQVNLLRFLEEREFYPVGGTRKKKVDVRVIAATNKSLATQVQEGTFREDLYYRLNVARVYVPPLVERKADIVPLTELFMNRFNEKFIKNFRGISPEARKMLVQYPWRGNIRELKNAVERVVLMEDGEQIEAAHLAFLAFPYHGGQAGQPPKVPDLRLPPEGIQLDEVIKDLIVQALAMSGANKTQAAKLLGISRPTLIYRIEKHGIRV